MLTITLNAALDVTYAVPGFRIGASHSASSVTAQAGGKGLNVARVLSQLGHQVTVTGLLAGPTGREIRDDLAQTPLQDSFVEVAGDSRRTVTIVDELGATTINERGDHLEIDDWDGIEEQLASALDGHEIVVASGSLPPAVPADAYARLTARVHQAGGRIVVDATGPALLAAAFAGADLVKPNAEELAIATGLSSVEGGVQALLDLGALSVATSLGPDGVFFRSRTETLTAHPPMDVAGNPTGAGDAMVAALASALAEDAPAETALARAVALSAAAVSHPLAGHVSQELYEQILGLVTVVRTEP